MWDVPLDPGRGLNWGRTRVRPCSSSNIQQTRQSSGTCLGILDVAVGVLPGQLHDTERQVPPSEAGGGVVESLFGRHSHCSPHPFREPLSSEYGTHETANARLCPRDECRRTTLPLLTTPVQRGNTPSIHTSHITRYGMNKHRVPSKLILSDSTPTAHSSQFENNYFTEMCSGSEAGSYLRLIDFCITPL